MSRYNRRPRRAAKKKVKEERQPGYLADAMRRRMGDALADLFDKFGPEIFGSIELQLKDTLTEAFTAGVDDVKNSIKEELGKRGVEESVPYFSEWINGIVEDITHFAMDNAAGGLEDLASSLAAEYTQDEGDELFEVDDEDVEEVEEIDEEAVEPVEEEEAEGGESFEDLFEEVPAEEAEEEAV